MKKCLFFRNDYGANAARQSQDKFGGVGYYRIIQPSKYVKGADVIGAKLTKKGESAEQRWTRVFSEYDIFWCSYFSDPQLASEMFYHRDKFKKKIVIDLDDNYLDVSPTHHLYDRFKPAKRDRAFTSTILSFADLITVSTLPLKQRLEEHFKQVYKMEKNIVIVPNMNDKKDWRFKPAKIHKDKIVIGYAGSNSHFDDLAMFLPHLSKVMDKYKNVWFEIVGSVGESDAIKLFKDFSEDAKGRCVMIPPTWTFNEYPKHLISLGWQIAVAPLCDTAFTRCKSPIKFFEYSMCRLPVIASKVYPYYVPSFGREVITHEENGLLVKPSEWSDAMEALITNESLRAKLGESAYKHISTNWQYSDGVFSDVLAEVIKAL